MMRKIRMYLKKMIERRNSEADCYEVMGGMMINAMKW